MRNVRMLLVFLTMLACGTENALDTQNQTSEESAAKNTTNLASSADAIVINGYISPMNISVDGTQYLDSEDFYTQEVDRLNAMVAEQYPQHQLFFDAEVGLRDFKRDLTVYLAAVHDENGVADEAGVNGKGQFTFNLPAKIELKQSYLLRAYKRIGLRLQKGNEVISWCYNFFAEKEVVIEKDKALILREFNTKVTKYQCAEQKKSGISLPYPDMPGIPVTEAFENAERWPGYGPTPKGNSASQTPINNPSEPSSQEDTQVDEYSQDDIDLEQNTQNSQNSENS